MAGAVVRIAILANAAKAKLELKQTADAADNIGKKFEKFRAPAAGALAAIGVGAYKAIGGASDLNETISKSDTIFGKNAAAMKTWAGGAKTSLGLSKAQALDAASGFGDMFTQIGFGGDQAAKMSKGVVQMSADLGSFNNLETSDVAERMSAAFRGEYDSLQALIPNINAARVEQEAMAATGKKSAKDLTAQEKATAVLAIVQKDGARAAGDFARTQGGAANQTKIATATAADLAASLGQKALPAYIAVLGVANRVLTMFSEHEGAAVGVIAAVGLIAVGLLAASVASKIYAGALAVSKIATATASAAQWLYNKALLGGAKAAAAAIASGARTAAAWTLAGVAAARSAAQMAAAWVAMQARAAAGALVSLAQVAAAWTLSGVSAARAAAVQAGAWVAAQAQAVAATAVIVAAKTREGAAWVISRGAMLASVVATGAVTAAQWLLNAALTANPIGIIVVALALLVGGLILAWRNSETFRTVVTAAFNGVKAVASAVWSWLKSATTAVWGFIKAYVGVQMAAVRAILTGLQRAAAAVWGAIKRGAELVWAGIRAVVSGAIRAVTAVLNAYRNVVLAAWNLIRAGAARAWSAIRAAVTGAVNAAVSKFNTLRSTASSVVSRIKSLFSPGALINAGRQLIAGLATGIRQKIDAAVGAVRAGVQKIKDLLPGSPIKDGPLKSWNNGGAGKRLMGLLRTGIRAGAGGVKSELNSVLSAIANPTVEPALSLSSGSVANLAGAGGPGTVQHITVKIEATPGTNLAELGRELNRSLKAYKDAGGKLTTAAP